MARTRQSTSEVIQATVYLDKNLDDLLRRELERLGGVPLKYGIGAAVLMWLEASDETRVKYLNTIARVMGVELGLKSRTEVDVKARLKQLLAG